MEMFINKKREKNDERNDNKKCDIHTKKDNCIEMLINESFNCFLNGNNDQFLLCLQELEQNKHSNNNMIKKHIEINEV